jgi:DNA-binding NarL/FixJ family response regulator
MERPEVPAEHDPLHVYLVENSAIMVPFLIGLLDAEPGLRIVGHAGDASTAIREIDQLRPDVVVVDISLDDSSGFDVLKHFHARGAGAPLRIILSNLASLPYRQAARKLGVTLFFDKSTDIRAMLRLMHQLAEKKKRDPHG